MTHEWDMPTDEECKFLREREQRRIPKGFIRVFDRSLGLMGNYTLVSDTPENRKNYRVDKESGYYY